MKQQTIYFLQALWDIEQDAMREKISGISREALLHEIETAFAGVMHERTLWVSDQSLLARQRIIKLKEDLAKVNRPNQLIRINQEFQTLQGEISGMQIQTMQTLHAGHGPMLDKVHIIARQIQPFAISKIREQCYYQLYRLMVLCGSWPDRTLQLPQEAHSSEWIRLFRDRISPLLAQQRMAVLDGRWAYERRKISLGKVQLEQFIRVQARPEEIRQMVGAPSIGSGSDGSLRIFGRGAITNLTPGDIDGYKDDLIIKNLSSIQNLSYFGNENSNPLQVLERLFGKRKYLIMPEKYFAFINKAIIAETFYQRVTIGNCIYCGSPLYHGKCSSCGM